MSKDSKEAKREVLGVSSISHKFQTTIPKSVRERMKLRAEDRITFIEEDGTVYIRKSTEL
jgi:AbrB family looped-hinge helix DNA binding protein